jgi:hypothetical protein
MIRRKPVPDLIRDGNQFADMREINKLAREPQIGLSNLRKLDCFRKTGAHFAIALGGRAEAS